MAIWINKNLVTQYGLLVCIIIRHVVCSCMFPERMQGHKWYTNIRPSMRSRTEIYFLGNVMKGQDEQTDTKYVVPMMDRECVQMVDLGKYIVKYSDDSGEDKYGCIYFIERSNSIVQLMMSQNFDRPTSDSCRESNLKLDPWLLVSYKAAQEEFSSCPFSGGYNMKIRDSNDQDHGCNFMDLPMRFESECLTGEAINFNFRSANCIGDLPMEQLQKALCITNWRHDGDVITVLRKTGTDTIWCLRIPARAEYSSKLKIYLFTDAVCHTGSIDEFEGKYYTLELELVIQHSLCVDEHPNCHILPCNGFFESQCLKSCGKCDANVYPTACDFPRKARGDWFLGDQFGIKSLNISASRFHIDGIGDFDCTTFAGSPQRKSKLFTTKSVFNNGCRPRYTCLGFKRQGPNIFAYTLGQSLVWPVETSDKSIGETICDPARFQADPAPVRDTYRPYSDVYKPIMKTSNDIHPQSCSLISSYLFNISFPDGSRCHGALYQDCADETRMRVEYNNCWSEASFVDYVCLGRVDGRYWERIIMVQNVKDMYDTRCVMFSDLEQSRILMLPSGQCDKYSWRYVNAGIRTPLSNFTVAMEDTHCRKITTTTTPPRTNTTTKMQLPAKNSWRDYGGQIKGSGTDRQSAGKESETTPSQKYTHIQNDDSNTKIASVQDYDKANSSASYTSQAIDSSKIVLLILAIFLRDMYIF